MFKMYLFDIHKDGRDCMVVGLTFTYVHKCLLQLKSGRVQ